MLYFAAALFTRAGAPRDLAATALVVANAALLVLGTLPGMWAVDRAAIGRRRLLLWGAGTMALFHLAIALLVSAAEAAPAGSRAGGALSIAAVASLFCFTFAFSASFGPVVWVLSSEVFSLDVRAQGVALGTLVNWASNAAIGKAVPLAVEAWGGLTFLVFFACCAAGGAFVFACVPETAGVPLEAMGSVFGEAGARPLAGAAAAAAAEDDAEAEARA